MPESPEKAAASEKLIVVVDDDEGVREMLEFVIKKEGFRVEMCSDGQEAIDKIPAWKPDLVILDMMLPHYGGFEVLRRLQGGPAASVPIIIITGRFGDRSTMEMMRQESNVVEFIQKPLRPPILAMTLHKRLNTLAPGMTSGSGGTW